MEFICLYKLTIVQIIQIFVHKAFVTWQMPTVSSVKKKTNARKLVRLTLSSVSESLANFRVTMLLPWIQKQLNNLIDIIDIYAKFRLFTA